MKSKRVLGGFAVATLFIATGAYAETIAQKSVNRAGEVIDAAIEAHGGADRLSDLKTITQEYYLTGKSIFQSRKPEPPWDPNHTTVFSAIDLENEIFVARNQGEGGGGVFHGGQVINGEDSYQINYRAGTAASITEPDYNTTSGPFTRITPALLMRQLMARRNTSHWLGETSFDGRPHDAVTLVMEVGPGLTLYFDKKTHLLTRSERVLPPFGNVEYFFTNYKSIDGIQFNQNFELYVSGDPNLDIDFKSTRVDAPVEQYTVVPSSLERVAAVQPDPLSLQEIDDGVYLIGGTGTYAMFVEMDDYIVAVGATAGIPDRIAELRKEVPDKPIRYAVLTHHHNDHLVGVATYIEEGATLITVKENETIVQNTVGDDANAKLEFVDGKRVISNGGRRVEIHDIGPTPHAEHLLVAYLPKEGIIFEADHFALPLNGSNAPANPNTVAFSKAIESRSFDVRKFIGAHSPRVGDRSDLVAALEMDVDVVARGGK